MPTTQRRSKPVKGSVLAGVVFSAPTVVVGVVEVGSLVGSLLVGSFLAFSSDGFFSSLDGEVPALGFGVVVVFGVVAGVVAGVVVGVVVFGVGAVWLYPLVGSAARAVAGTSSNAASSTATGTTRRLGQRLDDPFVSGVAPVFRDLLEATTSIRVMPTSRW
jgi:hypothetical protein